MRLRCAIGTSGPAAYTSVCRPPKCEATSSTTVAACADDVTSSCQARDRAPVAAASSTTRRAARSRWCQVTATVEPRSARRRAIVRPSPPEPPTTRAAPERREKSSMPSDAMSRPGSAVTRLELNGVPAARAVGDHVGSHRGLGGAAPVRGPDHERVLARLHRRLAAPLHPGVVVGPPAELGLLPRSAVELYLDLLDARVLGPGGAAEPAPAGCDLLAVAWYVDARLGLDGSLRCPATLGPVGREV